MPRPFSHLARTSAELAYVKYFLENWLLDELAGRLMSWKTYSTPYGYKEPLMSSAELRVAFERAPKLGNFMLVTSTCSYDRIDPQTATYFGAVLRVAKVNEKNILKTYVRIVDEFVIEHPYPSMVAEEILGGYVEREYRK